MKPSWSIVIINAEHLNISDGISAYIWHPFRIWEGCVTRERRQWRGTFSHLVFKHQCLVTLNVLIMPTHFSCLCGLCCWSNNSSVPSLDITCGTADHKSLPTLKRHCQLCVQSHRAWLTWPSLALVAKVFVQVQKKILQRSVKLLRKSMKTSIKNVTVLRPRPHPTPPQQQECQ